ncbi:unnamed protein product [Urochloa humidicola]
MPSSSSEGGLAEFDSLLDTNAGLTQPGQNSAADDIDFSTASDNDIMDHLRAWWSKRRIENPLMTEADAAIARQDPSVIVKDSSLGYAFYYATSMWGSDEKTQNLGYWKEQHNGLKIIAKMRTRRKADGRESRYIGLRRTLEFHLKDGTKTNWLMVEYIDFLRCEGHDIVKVGSVLRKVFQEAGLLFNSIPSMNNINGERGDDLDRNNICHSDGFHHHDTAQNNQEPSGKRLRTDYPKIRESDVWQHFTRIYVNVPKEDGPKKKKDGKKLVDGAKRKEDCKKYVYVVCHYCDKVFHADSKQGTSHHRRHAEACRCKHSQRNSNETCNHTAANQHGDRRASCGAVVSSV